MSEKIFIEMGHHPQVILDTLDQIRSNMKQAEAGASRRKRSRRMGCGGAFALLLLGAFFFLLDAFLEYGLLFMALGAILGLLGVIWFIASLVAARAPGILKRFTSTQHQFDAAYQILHTLRDDTGRKGHVVGWLDLTGAQQRAKQIRSGRTLSGKPKVTYQDPWFQVKIKLADGNLLRLALIDKVKTKSGWVAGHATQIKGKLVLNPDLYPLTSLLSGSPPLQTAIITEENGAIVFKALAAPSEVPVHRILATIKYIYSHLEPVGPGPATGYQGAGMEA
jgi:hypothetical protein